MERLNRERFSELSQATREALANMAKLRELHPEEKVIGENDFIPDMHHLFKYEWECRNDEKIYVLTKKVTKRVENMDIKSLFGEIELIDSLLNEDRHGHIIIPKEAYNGHDDMSSFFVIKDGRLWMHICVGEYKIGYVLADKDFSPYLEMIPWSIISMIRYKSMCAKKEFRKYEEYFRSLLEEFPELKEGDTKTFLDKISDKRFLKKVHDRKVKLKSLPIFQMHAFATQRCMTMLKALVFMLTSEVYSKTYVPDPTPSYIRKKGFRPLNYIQVDTTWDMDIDVNTPFPVRGHFVHQPCKKDGKWTRKLIYVEQYMKKGYHRKAKKTLEKFDKQETV